MKEYVKMFESGGFEGSRFDRIATMMHSYIVDWRDYGYEMEPIMDIVAMDLPDLLDKDPEGTKFFGDKHIGDRIGLPSAAFVRLLSNMVSAHDNGDDDEFTRAYETAMGQIIDRSNAHIPHYVMLDYLLHMMFLVGMTDLGARGGAEEFGREESKPALDQDAIFDKVKKHGADSLTDEEKSFLHRFVGESLLVSFRSFCESLEKNERQ